LLTSLSILSGFSMPAAIQPIAFVLVGLACAVYGFRVQSAAEEFQPSPLKLQGNDHLAALEALLIATRSPISAASSQGLTRIASRLSRQARQTRTSESHIMASQPLKMIICGAPASGKGTQCELLKDTYGVVHLSTGDMLRAAVAAGTEVGKEAKGYMESGKLVPDDVIIGIVKDRLAEKDCLECGWLLDGFPRTEAQAKALENAGIVPNKVLFLNVPDELLVERVVGRRSDPETGKIYHLKYSPPESEEIAARLTQRADDTEEKVKPRLEAFHTHMSSVEKCYAKLISYVDGTKPKEAVFEELQTCLGGAGA
jgi:adenylate kinase